MLNAVSGTQTDPETRGSRGNGRRSDALDTYPLAQKVFAARDRRSVIADHDRCNRTTWCTTRPRDERTEPAGMISELAAANGAVGAAHDLHGGARRRGNAGRQPRGEHQRARPV